ncbi:hypothetical protein [Pseudaquidulcibacter saccharophilus]|uniref:hypothetical protein n=1 Tax=Pseudaquidulcibacter saccharophilus TaxID=2831900 RepID=UPI001EFF5B1A|nr:hypothetical protein [Pseudaquidulcibacter saccharophilus]
MRLKNLVTLAIISSAAIATNAMADGYSSPWIFSSSIGTEVSAQGTVVNDGIGTATDLSAYNAAYTSSIVQMRGRKYDDMYKTNIHTSFEVRYALSNLTEVFGSIGYTNASAKDNVQMGCLVSVAASGVCDTNLTGSANDLEQYMLELGWRQWFGGNWVKNPIKPYYAVHGGVVYTKEVSVDMKAGANSLGKMKLFDDGVTYTAGADLGASYTLSDSMELAAEVGVRYNSPLKKNSANNCTYGVCGTNDVKGQVTIPIAVRLNTVF